MTNADIIHATNLNVAQRYNKGLAKALREIGPVTLERRNTRGLSVTMSRAVVGQLLSTKAAHTIWQRVVDLAGEQPLQDFLVSVQPSQLRNCGLSRAKAKTVIALNQAFEQGQLVESELELMSHAQRSKELRKFWGIGHWTADMVSLFYFADEDVWPDGDAAVMKTFLSYFRSPDRARVVAQKFAPYRSYIALSMWRIKDNKPVE